MIDDTMFVNKVQKGQAGWNPIMKEINWNDWSLSDYLISSLEKYTKT